MKRRLHGATVLIVGATSPIARQVAEVLMGRGCRIHLAARDETEVRRIAADLAVRYGAAVECDVLDVTKPAQHEALLDRAQRALGTIDGVVIAVGMVGEQQRAASDAEYARAIIEANYTGVAMLAGRVANGMEQRGQGFIVVLSSVAGDRGRQSNYVYGSAKAGLDVFLEGLRHRLSPRVSVLTVKPGFVDTRMTYGSVNSTLTASPAYVAERIVCAVERGREVLYVPAVWRLIMLVIRSLPSRIMHRTRL